MAVPGSFPRKIARWLRKILFQPAEWTDGQAAGRVARSFEQPVDWLNDCWSYILFDWTDRSGLIPVRSFLSFPFESLPRASLPPHTLPPLP